MSGSRSTMSSAREPLSASITVNCSSLSIAAVTARTPASSSTSRIVRSWPEISAASVSLDSVRRLEPPHRCAADTAARGAAADALSMLHVTARLLDEAVHHAQAEPGAVPEILGREERLDRALQHFRRSCRRRCRSPTARTKSPAGNVVVLAAASVTLLVSMVSVPPSVIASRAFTARLISEDSTCAGSASTRHRSSCTRT